jgi:hypothetical protein
MTLLEAVVAFVLLSLVGVVCLDQARGASQLQASSAEWTQAVALGEAALATAASGAPVELTGNTPAQPVVVTERRAWRSGLDLVTVQVRLSHGGTYRISRLIATDRQLVAHAGAGTSP